MKTLVNILQPLAQDKSILIIEDNLEILEYLSQLLRRFFSVTYTAIDAVKALEIYEPLAKNNSMVVITDINLGKTSGIDLTYALKHLNPQQKVIAISGTEDKDVFIESIRCGIDNFIVKPINTDELFKALINVLKKMEYDSELTKNRKLLEDSQKYAIQLLAEQDQFLKNAIHEIHTPLAVIITNIDLLRIEKIENESLNSIEAAARIIENSYEDMTYLMKLNRINDTKENINIVSFIKKRINYFTCIAEANKLSFSTIVGQANLPEIYFSELKLSRLVDNTLSNAIKYSKRPTNISVTIGLQKGNVFFEIRNYGPIIEEKEKIFERYYRESEQKSGYGLGLHIVAQICNEENVKVEVSSSKRRGTSFRYIF